MKVSRVLTVALLAVLSFCAMAADLTFDLKINRGAEVDCNPQVKKQTIAIFVIDCSGSMKDFYTDQNGEKYYGPSGRDEAWRRDKVVAEKLLPERFEALPAGTLVYVYLYSLRPGGYLTEEKEVLVSDKAKKQFLQKLQKKIGTFFWKVRERGGEYWQGGATPYYDTMARVLQQISQSGLLNNPKVKLELYDYTDGLNATGNARGFKYASNHNLDEKSYQIQLANAKRRFLADCGGILNLIAKKGFYEQLNVGTKKENPEVKHIPAYKVAFNCDKSSLKNPGEAASQRVPLYASFPVNQESWNLLQNAQSTVKIQFDNDPVQSYPVSLRQSGHQIKVVVPPDAMNKATTVKVFFDCPKGVQGKFTLIPPSEPVIIRLPPPDPAKAVIETVTIQNQVLDSKTVMTVLKGKPVYFTAGGFAKNYIWRFSDGPTLKGEYAERTFDKIGDYSFTVSAEGNPQSKQTGRIKVVEIGIKIINQGDKITIPDKWESFEARVEKNLLTPSRTDWYVVGPITGNTQEIPAITPLDSQSNPLRNRFFFKKSGEYKIKVTAKYDELPLETIESETPWTVSEPATIAFSKSMEGEGKGFDFGKEVTLSIDVTGKIDEKSIVWKANGEPFAKNAAKVTYTRPVAKGSAKVEFTVEATDPVMKKKLVLKRTYSFGCSHTEPIVKAVRKDGSTSWGIGAEVDFRVTPEDQYTDICWTFGDDPDRPVKVTNGQNVIHRVVKAGKFKNILTCRCRKCQTLFTKELETETQYKEPKSRIQLKPEKSSYSKGDGVLLCDAGEGDYFRCRLLILNPETGKFEEYKTLERNFEEEISLGSEKFPVPRNERADFVFKIQALDKDGKPALDKDGKPVESVIRTVRVRNHWITAAILGCLVLLFAIIFWHLSKLLLNNEPRGWELYYTKNDETPPLERAESQRVLDGLDSLCLKDKGSNGKRYWSRCKHLASIELSEFLDGYSDKAVLKIAPLEESQHDKYYFENASYRHNTLPCNPGKSGVVFEIEPESGDSKETIYLELVLDEESNYHGDAILYWGLFILVVLALLGVGLWWFKF